MNRNLLAVLGLIVAAGCGSHETPVEPETSLNCRGLSFNATMANTDGAATLTKVLVSSDGDPYTYTFKAPGGAATSVGMTVTFRYDVAGKHTVRVVVADQTHSPSTYRLSGDYAKQLSCVTPHGSAYEMGPLRAQTARLATGDSMAWDFQF